MVAFDAAAAAAAAAATAGAVVFFKSEDIKEGLAAVKEKRQPCFTSTAALDPTLAEAGSPHGGSSKQG
jgi:hypothetical protein